MNPTLPLALLGGLTPDAFMRKIWQRKPLLIRQAIPDFRCPLSTNDVRKLSRSDDAESRLIWREDDAWQMEPGPFARLPKPAEPGWTLLVQSLEQHLDWAATLMAQFRFIPDARLDDIMVSVATDGGGVGPHFDSYDVFLLQARGKRRWRISQQKDLTLVPDLPLKILQNFQPEEEFVLEAGDMLYLPPQAAHDGIAVGDDCMTLSIGFRSADRATLARGMLEAAAEQLAARSGMPTGPYGEPPLPGPDLSARYRDPGQAATDQPAALPEALVDAAVSAANAVKLDANLATRFLGCWLSEPNARAVFDDAPDELPMLAEEWPTGGRLRLDRRSRMLYRGKQLFINGECAPVTAEAGLRALADARELDVSVAAAKRLSPAARDCLDDWLDAGWLHFER